MTWQDAVPKWAVRVVCSLMLAVAVPILAGKPGWEHDFDPPLSERETKLVRSGVLFEMCFQAGLWFTSLVAGELGSTKVQAGLCGTMSLTMLFCGPYGLPTWLYYGEGENDPQYKPEIISQAVTMSYAMAGILGTACLIGFTNPAKDSAKKE